MVVFPTAKINFGLNILSRRSDGYHNIESIFYPVGIKDALEINPASADTTVFKTYGTEIPGDPENNLVLKAWKCLQAEFTLPHITISLLKSIPTGGGIGGGSSDAAFFINLVNEYFALKIPLEKRKQIAVEMGSDCAFFIENKPAFVSGRGEQMEEALPVLKGYFLVLLYSGLHISTKEAYEGITPARPPLSLKELYAREPHTWKENIKNDFETIVFAKYPALSDLKNKLYGKNAVYASLSGTGSCIYGLFDHEVHDLDIEPAWSGWL